MSHFQCATVRICSTLTNILSPQLCLSIKQYNIVFHKLTLKLTQITLICATDKVRTGYTQY